MTCEVFNNSDFGMIEGCQQTFTVDIYNILGEEYQNIAIESAEWRMSRYGETEMLLSKTSETKDVRYNKNKITITVDSSDTLNLFGKFTHQLLVTDSTGSTFIADLGKISIKPMIK